jgi:hypothetical protein
MRLRLPWPLPALLAWGLAWAALIAMNGAGASPVQALAVACLVGVCLSLLGPNWWRRLIIGAGFPVSLAVSGLVVIPAWGWLLLLGILVLIYPVNAWRDAPLFPTPLHALKELPRWAPLPPEAPVLDAGCGLGHGLRALRSAYPLAQLNGLEWSWPLRWLSALRCPWARVRQGDIWLAPWSGYQMVYLFQRPESMARAVAKARAELQAGDWLVSLEFEATELQARARYQAPDGKMVWLYQAPFQMK